MNALLIPLLILLINTLVITLPLREACLPKNQRFFEKFPNGLCPPNPTPRSFFSENHIANFSKNWWPKFIREKNINSMSIYDHWPNMTKHDRIWPNLWPKLMTKISVWIQKINTILIKTSSQAPSYARRLQSETTTYRLTDLLTGMRCRATSVAKNAWWC